MRAAGLHPEWVTGEVCTLARRDAVFHRVEVTAIEEFLGDGEASADAEAEKPDFWCLGSVHQALRESPCCVSSPGNSPSSGMKPWRRRRAMWVQSCSAHCLAVFSLRPATGGAGCMGARQCRSSRNRGTISWLQEGAVWYPFQLHILSASDILGQMDRGCVRKGIQVLEFSNYHPRVLAHSQFHIRESSRLTAADFSGSSQNAVRSPVLLQAGGQPCLAVLAMSDCIHCFVSGCFAGDDRSALHDQRRRELEFVVCMSACCPRGIIIPLLTP